MASNDDQNTSNTVNNNNINDSSYHLKTLSFEDSQVDHFIPYSSPSILYWQTNKKFMKEYQTESSKLNMSDIEKKRGNSSNQNLTNLVQIPAENTFDLTTNPTLINPVKNKSSLIENFEQNNSKIQPQSLKAENYLNPNLSNFKDKSSLTELNKSKTLADLENNVQKRLEFLDMSEHSSHSTNDVSSSERSEMDMVKIKIPQIHIENPSLSLHDDTAEILQELSAEEDENDADDEKLTEKKIEQVEIENEEQKVSSEEQEQEKEIIDSFFDPKVDYFKIIDEKLTEMKKKKLELLTSDKLNKKLSNFKKSYSAVSWDISPNIPSKNSVKTTKSTKNNSTSFSYEIIFDKDNNEMLKGLKNCLDVEDQNQQIFSNDSVQFDQLKNIVKEPIKVLIDNSNRTKSAEKNKENRVSEACTQTSFIQQPANSGKSKKQLMEDGTKKSPFSQIKFDTSQQKKFKQMIEAQKHEKRYRELELLAKLERLQAERLKKLIIENDSDSSSILCDSYFKTSSSFLDKDGTLDTDKLEHVIDQYKAKSTNNKKSEFIKPKSYPRLQNFDDLSLISEADSVLDYESPRASFKNLRKSQVEVLNLKNTSIYQQPKGVFVIKENEMKSSSSKSSLDSKQNSEKDSRVFFSNITNQREIKVEKNTIKNVQSEPSLKYHKPEKNLQSLSNKQIEQSINDSKNSTSVFHQLNLQEAFKLFKKDLIVRSQRRVNEIEERSRLRHEQAENERKCAQINMKLKEVQRKLNRQTSLGSGKWSKSQINQNQENIRRRMSSQEIKNLTKRNYEKLPEVKQKQYKEHLEQTKKLNLIKSSIYKKSIQLHVLSKGPNFDLNFKALDN